MYSKSHVLFCFVSVCEIVNKRKYNCHDFHFLSTVDRKESKGSHERQKNSASRPRSNSSGAERRKKSRGMTPMEELDMELQRVLELSSSIEQGRPIRKSFSFLIILTYSQNLGRVIFLLQFVCLSMYPSVSKQYFNTKDAYLDTGFAKWLLIPLAWTQLKLMTLG